MPAAVPMGELVGGLTFAQTFVSRCSKLSEIDLDFATYARRNTHPVVVGLTDPATQRVIFKRRLEAPRIRDNTWLSFVFPALKNSRDRTYSMWVTSPRSLPGNAVTLWRSASDTYPRGRATINGKPVNGDIAFSYACAN